MDTHTYKGTNMTLANFNMENIVRERERKRKVFSLLFFYNIIVPATVSNQRQVFCAFSSSFPHSLSLRRLRSLLFSVCDCLAAMTVDDE